MLIFQFNFQVKNLVAGNFKFFVVNSIIGNKIYVYIGAHPIVLNTDLKNKMNEYNNCDEDDFEDDFNDTFADYYFNIYFFMT